MKRERYPMDNMYKTDRTLYCFMLDPASMTIDMVKISTYGIRELRGGQSAYYFRNPKTGLKAEVKFSNINRFFYNKLYTFEDNESKALGIIYNELASKATRANKDLEELKRQMHALKTKPHDDIFVRKFEDLIG